MSKAKILVAGTLLGVLLPAATYALTVDEIRAQIQSLLQQVSALQAQISGLTSTSTSASSTTAGVSCPSVNRTLGRGERGDDVLGLQRFLINEGVLAADGATGFFGPLTESGVQKWQAVQGIVTTGDAASTGFGNVGARTRVAILARCKVATVTPTPVTPPASCPTYNACPSGYKTETSYDTNKCLRISCTLPTTPTECPVYNACPLGYSTIGSYDSRGCYAVKCEAPVQPSSPSITVSASSEGSVVSLGDPITINWKASNVPADAVVSLALFGPLENGSGFTPSLTQITANLPHSSSHKWTISKTIVSSGDMVPTLMPGTYQIEARVGPRVDFTYSCAGSSLLSCPMAPLATPLAKAVSGKFTIKEGTTKDVQLNPTISLNTSNTVLFPGSKVTIKWNAGIPTSTYVNQSGVYAALYLTGTYQNSQGNIATMNGIIARALGSSGEYTWTLPPEYSPFLPMCADCPGIQTLFPGSYVVSVKFYTPKDAWLGDSFPPLNPPKPSFYTGEAKTPLILNSATIL